MDVLDRFFRKFAYKFDKGYPDMNNKQDVLLLESILDELGIDLNEANTGDATLFEAALVQAWYNINKKEVPEDAIDPKESAKLEAKPDMVKKAEDVVKSLNLSGGSSAQGTGRGINASLTPFWSSKGATNKTPKAVAITSTLPPAKMAPPITGAANDGNNQESPILGVPNCNLHTTSIPPIAANKPEII